MLIVDGISVPTRDHTVANQSKSYRYSTNYQIVVGADPRLGIAVCRPLRGSRNDSKAWELPGAKAAVGAHDGLPGYRPAHLAPPRSRPGRTARLEGGAQRLAPQGPRTRRARLCPHEDLEDPPRLRSRIPVAHPGVGEVKTTPAGAGGDASGGEAGAGGERPSPRVPGRPGAVTCTAGFARDQPRWWRSAQPGPSPRVRGRPVIVAGLARRRGTIPAGAGATETERLRGQRPPDHPRGCGGDLIGSNPAFDASGPSPRVRGRRQGRSRLPERRRTIPAGAGATAPSTASGTRRSDHPRGCGGDSPPRTAIAA